MAATARQGALARALGLALAVSVPAALVAQVVEAVADHAGAATYPLSLVVLAGAAVGGAAVGGRRPERAARWGALVGVVDVGVVLALGIARRAAAGDDVAWGAGAGALVLALALGGASARLAAARPGRTRP